MSFFLFYNYIMNNTIIELKEDALHNSQDSNYLVGNNGDYTCQIGEVN